MKKLSKEDKIKKVLNNGGVFELGRTKNKIRYVVKGTTGTVYEILYEAKTGVYKCDCKNIRLTDCYHKDVIKAYQLNSIGHKTYDLQDLIPKK